MVRFGFLSKRFLYDYMTTKFCVLLKWTPTLSAREYYQKFKNISKSISCSKLPANDTPYNLQKKKRMAQWNNKRYRKKSEKLAMGFPGLYFFLIKFCMFFVLRTFPGVFLRHVYYGVTSKKKHYFSWPTHLLRGYTGDVWGVPHRKADFW